MKKLTCDEGMNRFLQLDKDEWIPFDITFHLLTCKKCRSQVRALTMADRACSAPLHIDTPVSDESITQLMQKIIPEYKPQGSKLKPITMRRWVISGIAMIIAMLVFGTFDYIKTDSLLSIAFYIFFALAVTCYCGLFIGSNMDFFVKKFETLRL